MPTIKQPGLYTRKVVSSSTPYSLFPTPCSKAEP
jgi:hypothetical protein